MPTFSNNVCYVWFNVRSPCAFIAANTVAQCFILVSGSIDYANKGQNYNTTAPLKVISENSKSDSELVK